MSAVIVNGYVVFAAPRGSYSDEKGICMHSRLDKITDWLKRVEVSNYSIKQLAKSSKSSLRQLERYFKWKFWKSPQTWINEVRLIKAKQFMEAGYFVKEAANRLGYKQSTHFSREFKRFHGVAPTVAAKGNSPIVYIPRNKARRVTRARTDSQ